MFLNSQLITANKQTYFCNKNLSTIWWIDSQLLSKHCWWNYANIKDITIIDETARSQIASIASALNTLKVLPSTGNAAKANDSILIFLIPSQRNLTKTWPVNLSCLSWFEYILLHWFDSFQSVNISEIFDTRWSKNIYANKQNEYMIFSLAKMVELSTFPVNLVRQPL